MWVIDRAGAVTAGVDWCIVNCARLVLATLQAVQQQPKKSWKFMQKYWHKGAYYQSSADDQFQVGSHVLCPIASRLPQQLLCSTAHLHRQASGAPAPLGASVH